jgi:hypothetical protein
MFLKNVQDGVGFQEAVIWDFDGVARGILVQIELVLTTNKRKRRLSVRSPESLGEVSLIPFDDTFF